MAVTKEQIAEAIQYLDDIEKSSSGMDLSTSTNGGDSKTLEELQVEYVNTIKKAQEIKGEMEKLSPKEEISKAEEEVPEEESEEKEEEKADLDKEEIIKSVRDELFPEIGKRDEEIELLKSMISDLTRRVEEEETQPIKKSFTNGAPLTFKERFEKAEKEGKRVYSKVLQKSTISNHLYNLFVETEDEIEKGVISNAIAQFESAGFLDPSLEQRLQEKHNIEII